MGARLLGLVAMVQHEHALDEEEADEPGTDDRRHPARRVDQIECFREHVEERDRDDDAAGERDHGRSSLRRRNATTPPSIVEIAVATASGTASHAIVRP